jgi:hypothetical protein
LHGSQRIDGGDLDAIALGLLHIDIAQQQKAGLVFELERLMRQGRIEGSKDDIRKEIDIDLGFEGLLHIDLADHPKALGLESSLGARNCLLETSLNMGRN